MRKISLSSHFTYRTLIIQCLAPIMMMIFTSLYTVVDGLFISNFVGGDAFAGINLIAPMTIIVGSIGFMFGSGGSALASKYLGEKENEKANKVFGMMIELDIILVILVSAVLLPFVDDISIWLASIGEDCTEQTIKDATLYGQVLLAGQFIFCLQTLFHNFFVVNETPQAGFYQTLIAGITNIVFDAIFIICYDLKVLGAALGTIMGYIVGVAFSFLYIYFGKHNAIKISWCKPDFKTALKCSTNGASDFVFNISSAIVSLIYNIQLLKYFGQDGLNAFGVVMYINFIFVAIFIGFAIGTAPIIGYNFGAKNHKELHNVITKLLIITGILGVILTVIAEATAVPLASLFTNDPSIKELSIKAIRYYSISFLVCGFGIEITSMFTGLNDGFVSGLLSFIRTLVLQIVLVLVLPLIFDRDSIWWSIVVVELIATIISFVLYFIKRKKYHY